MSALILSIGKLAAGIGVGKGSFGLAARTCGFTPAALRFGACAALLRLVAGTSRFTPAVLRFGLCGVLRLVAGTSRFTPAALRFALCGPA
jgi:hypothetical protein